MTPDAAGARARRRSPRCRTWAGPGWAHLGVPRAGALDRARRRAGQPAGRQRRRTPRCSRCSLGGLAVRAGAGRWVAVTGAPAPSRSTARPRGYGAAVGCRAGASCGSAGRRPVCGPTSRSPAGSPCRRCSAPAPPTPSAWVGPPPVRGRGPRCRWGSRPGSPRPLDTPAAAARRVRCGCGPGPRADWVAADALDLLCAHDVHRVAGLQPGRAAAVRADARTARVDGELPSEGMVLGAVQVPPDGQPVVFLADHPTTGGYPVVGVVDERRPVAVRAAAARGRGAVHARRVRSGRQALSAGSSAGVGAHRARRGLGGLEADRHDARARRPTPSRGPSRRARRPCPGAQVRRRRRRAPRSRRDASSPRLGRRRRTGPPGSSRPARTRRRRAGGRRRRCRGRRAARGRAGRSWRALSVGEASVRRPAQRGEVVQPHLDRDRAARTGRACAAARRRCRPGG